TQTIYVTIGVTESCSTPTGFQLVSVMHNSALLSWNVVSGATSYRVRYRRADATFWTTVVTAATSINLPNLSPSTNYVATVAAICPSGTSLPTPMLSFTTASDNPPPCTQASNFNATAGPSSGTILVSWTQVPAATRYQVQYRRVGSPFWTTTSVNAPADAVLLTGLISGQSYEVRMRVVCGSTAMAWQAPITVIAPGGKFASSDESNASLVVYPNPARDWVGVRLDVPRTIFVYDFNGKSVMRFEGTAGDNVVDVSVLPPGVYLLRAGACAKLIVE
ncbi:MAG: fibronectin type III domain-containing protein, partial [Bacteroidia bacterium]|nr:fibronectin type III domain-containing protein [Bacteroidia bacterium]